MKSMGRWFAVIWIVVAGGAVAAAEGNKVAYQKQWEEAANNAFNALQRGPAMINLGDIAELTIPKEYGYIPAAQTQVLLKLYGNGSEGVMGAVTANPDLSDDSRWMVILRYNDTGHVMDDDARNWDTEELLAELKNGTEEANKIRRERGFDELKVLGWVQPPSYDAGHNRMLWSVKAQNLGSSEGPIINFNTLALSREGYMSMNLVTQLDRIDRDKTISEKLLASLDFKPGYQYGDFDADTDRIAEYGLAALITGAAAKKLGLFAVIAAFLAKFAKVIIAALAGLGIYFKRRKSSTKEKDAEEGE